jgi:hypothetical protein
MDSSMWDKELGSLLITDYTSAVNTRNNVEDRVLGSTVRSLASQAKSSVLQK